jgi:hypothetical protein
MLRALSHHGKDAPYEIERNVLLEEVRHAVHEDQPTSPPSLGQVECCRHEPKVESLLERMPRDTAKSLSESLGVAVLAAWRNLRAATYRVPRGLSPLDSRSVTHGFVATELMYSIAAVWGKKGR